MSFLQENFMFGNLSPCVQAVHNNRDILLETLTRLGISQVCITYEGGGDSGDVENVSVEPDALSPLLDTETVVVWQRSFVQGRYEQMYALDAAKPHSLADALKYFALDWLELGYSGWEINEGAQGTVTIDVAERRCVLEHRQFYTESTLYEDEL